MPPLFAMPEKSRKLYRRQRGNTNKKRGNIRRESRSGGDPPDQVSYSTSSSMAGDGIKNSVPVTAVLNFS
ncbi:hypothetical protein ACVW8M_003757, partial [Morganella morganii]